MGTSTITIRITGNHGCQREVRNGGDLRPTCERGAECARGCVDAIAREFVERLRSAGMVEEANLLHWPNSSPRIVDDLLNGKRYGSF
jgi:hypothetical protein